MNTINQYIEHKAARLDASITCEAMPSGMTAWKLAYRGQVYIAFSEAKLEQIIDDLLYLARPVIRCR